MWNMFCSLQAEQNYEEMKIHKTYRRQLISIESFIDFSSSRMLSIYIMPFVRCSTMRSYQLDLDTKQNTSLTCGKSCF